MLVLSWNNRGLGHPATIRSLRALIRKHSPACFVISEIKTKIGKIHGILNGMGYVQGNFHPPRGKSGGLCLAV